MLKDKGKMVPVLNCAVCHEDVLKSGGIASEFLASSLDGCGWSASRLGRFILQGKNPRYPLDRRLGGPQSRSGRCGLEKNLLPLPGIEPQISSRLASIPSLYRFNYPDPLYVSCYRT
jgi:hypothetical protein